MRELLHWSTKAPRGISIQIEYVDHFDARGMSRVYGRGDHFPGRAAFNMDVWLSRNGELFARFWSRSSEVDELSLAIRGIASAAIAKREPDAAFSDCWIPRALRKEYEDWVLSEL